MRTSAVFFLHMVIVFMVGQAPAFTQPAFRPNIVLIVADDLGFADIQVNGGQVPTPFLNQMAAEGINLTDFHTSGTVCSPTRAGLMTGQYQYRVGVPGVIVAFPDRPEHKHGLDPAVATMPKVFKDNGYATALFGKWHLGYSEQYNPLHYGFDRFRGFLSGQVDYHSHVDLAGNFDWWNGTQPFPDPGYTTHLITGYALDFIRENRARPFFLVVSYEAVHSPYQAPDDPAFRRIGKSVPQMPAASRRRDRQETFHLMTQEMDRGVGRIRALLKQAGLEKNTIVVFLSDNGGVPAVSRNTPFKGGKGQVWEGGHRVPALFCWPGTIPAGKHSGRLCSSLDMMPSLLDLCGLYHAEDYTIDGSSIARELLRVKTAGTGDRYLFWNMENQENPYAVRSQKWKLVGVKNGEPLLFDIRRDKGEQYDRSGKYPRVKKRMEQAYRSWKTEVGLHRYIDQ